MKSEELIDSHHCEVFTARVLSCIRNAESDSDSEKITAMLLIPKLNHSDLHSAKELLDSIDVRFLVRLLTTDSIADDCTQFTYKSVAVAVLQFFAALNDPVVMDELLLLIPALYPILVLENNSDSEQHNLVVDCYQCLNCLATTKKGQEVMLSSGTIAVLCRSVTRQCSGCDEAIVLLQYLLRSTPEELIDVTTMNTVHDLIQTLADQLRQPKDKDVFGIVNQLHRLISSCPQSFYSSRGSQSGWVGNVKNVLCGILQSRIGDKQREPVFHLCAALVNKLGTDWLISDSNESQFYFLLVHLAAVEVRMILEDTTTDQVVGKSDLLSSCYVIVESALLIIGNSIVDDKQCDLLMMALTDTFNAILSFLKTTQHPITGQLYSVVVASIRVLGSWLVNEQLSVESADLDFILTLCETYTFKKLQWTLSSGVEELTLSDKTTHLTFDTTHQQNDDVSFAEDVHDCDNELTTDILQFIIPGLCHLTGIDEPRHVIIDKKFHWLLFDYLKYLWSKFMSDGDSSDVKVTMVTLSGILLNIVVTEDKLVQRDKKFKDLFNFLLDGSRTLDNSHLVLKYNFITLCLLLVKAKLAVDDERCIELLKMFISLIQQTFTVQESADKKTLLTLTYQQVWNDIEELVFLSIQVLSNILPATLWLQQQLATLTMLFTEWIKQLKQVEVIDPRCNDILQSYNTLLTQLCQYSTAAKQTVINAGGLTVARKLNLSDFENSLK